MSVCCHYIVLLSYSYKYSSEYVSCAFICVKLRKVLQQRYSTIYKYLSQHQPLLYMISCRTNMMVQTVSMMIMVQQYHIVSPLQQYSSSICPRGGAGGHKPSFVQHRSIRFLVFRLSRLVPIPVELAIRLSRGIIKYHSNSSTGGKATDIPAAGPTPPKIPTRRKLFRCIIEPADKSGGQMLIVPPALVKALQQYCCTLYVQR